MISFNFDLQRFATTTVLNSIYSVSSTHSKYVMPYKNRDGFGIIYNQRIYFSGKNRYNRFGFGWNDRNSERNLMYKLPLKGDNGKELAIAAAAMNANGTIILTTDRRLFVCGKNTSYCLCGETFKDSEIIKEITEVHPEFETGVGLGDKVTQEDITKINNIYMGDEFALFTTDDGRVLGLGRKKYWDDVAPASYVYATKFCNIKQVTGVSKIAIGSKTTFLLKTNGELWVFSDNENMMEGTTQMGTSVKVTDYKKSNTGQRYCKILENIVDIDCDDNRAVAVDKNGKVYACGTFGCFDPWDNNRKYNGPLDQCRTLKNITALKARIYGHGIIVLDNKNKVWAIGNNNEGRLVPSNNNSIIRTPVEITYRLGTEHDTNHGIRDIKTFYNTPTHGKGSIFFSCKCSKEKIWVYGLGFGSELGNDKFIVDEDDLNFGYAYDYTTKIFGIDNAVFIARPDGVYAAGYNNKGELGAGNPESAQSVFVKVFDEQVDKIAIGKNCCLIQTHGAVFGAGQIEGNAINTPYFTPIMLGKRTDRVSNVTVAHFGNYSIPVIQKNDGVYAAGRNVYGFINPSLSENSNISTFTKIQMLNNATPIEFYNSNRCQGGFFYKTSSKKIIAEGVLEFYLGLRTDELKYHTYGNMIRTQTSAFPEITGEITYVSHMNYDCRNTTAITYNEGKTKGKVKVYTNYCRFAGVYSSKSYDQNATKNNWCVIDMSVTNVKKAIVGHEFLAMLTNDGKVYVAGRNESVKAYCTSNSRQGPTLVTDENSNNSVLSDIVDIQVVDKGIVMLQYKNNAYKVLLYGYFTDGTAGNGTMGAYINLKEPIAYLSADYKDNMLIEAGRHMSFMGITQNDKTTLYAIGHNYTGGLGIGDTKSTDEVDLKNNECTVALPKSGKIVSIHASDYSEHRSYIIYSDGEVYATGRNVRGELGIGNTTDSRSFKKVQFPNTNIKCIKVVSGNSHTLFLTDEGEVYGCGYAANGRLGNALKGNITTPVLIAGGGEENNVDVNSGVDIVDIAAGDTCSFLIDSDGNLYVSGTNTEGEFGNGSAKGTIYTHFTKNELVEDAVAIYASLDTSFYVSHDYHLYGAGKRLPHLSTGANRLKFALCRQTPYPSRSFLDSFSIGNSHGGYIEKASPPYMFGSNAHGQLGRSGSHVEVKLKEINNAIKLSCGMTHTLVLTANGLVYSFGQDAYHQLGRSANYYNRQNRRGPGYVFCLFPYVIGTVDDDTGTFTSLNGKTYQYKFIYNLKSYNTTQCTYNIQVAVGCDIDTETNSVNYALYKTYTKTLGNDNSGAKDFTFTRFQTNTIDDELYNHAMELLGKIPSNSNATSYKWKSPADTYSIKYILDHAVYELDDIQCIDSHYFRDGLGCYYYRIDPEIGEYTPHVSTSVTIKISLEYYLKTGDYVSTFTPTKYDKTYSIPSDLTTTITVRGGGNCTTDYKSVTTVMKKIEDNFIAWIKNTPVPLQCKFTVDGATGPFNVVTVKNRAYTAKSTGKVFNYTIGCTFDSGNYKESYNTTMTVTYSVVCVSEGNRKLDFTYTGSRSYPFTYYNRSEVQTRYDEKVKNLENDHQENNKTIIGIKTFCENYVGLVYSALDAKSTVGKTIDLSAFSGNQGLQFVISKYDKVESDSSLTYGVYANVPVSGVPSGENDAKRIVKQANLTFTNTGVASWTYTTGTAIAAYNKTTVNGQSVDFLQSKAATRNVKVTLSNYKTYQNKVSTELNTMATDLQNSLANVVGLIFEPVASATFKYQPGNGETYTIRATIDVNNNYRAFTDTSVSVNLIVETMPSGRTYFTKYKEATYNIVGTANPNASKNEVAFSTHRASLVSILNNMIDACKEKLKNVIPDFWGPQAEMWTDSTYDGQFYFFVQSRPGSNFVPFETQKMNYTTTLNYGRSYRNWPTAYRNIDNSVIPVSGLTLLSDKNKVNSSFEEAYKKFIKEKNPIPPTQNRIPDYYQTYTHKDPGDNGYIYAVYRIRIYYDIEQDPKNKYSYNTYHNLKYSISLRNNKVDDYYNPNPIWYHRCRALKVINNSNYTQYPDNVKKYGEDHKDRLIKEIQNYLSSKLISIEPTDFDGNIAMVITTGYDIFKFPNGIVIYCEKTRLLFDIHIETTLVWNGKCPETSTKLKTMYKLKWSYRLQNQFKDKLIPDSGVETTIDNYHTYKARITKCVSDMLDAADKILETFIGPIELPSIDKAGYTASTGYNYYIRHKFTVTMPPNDYTQATVLVEEEWDSVDSFNNHRPAWAIKDSILITANNYIEHTLLIYEMGVSLRNRFKTEYLNWLVPPVEDNYPDVYGTLSVIGTGTIYEYWFTYTVFKNTDFTYNGTATIGYEIVWKDINKQMDRRSYGTLQTNINKDNYIVRKTKLDDLRDTCVKSLQAHCDLLVPPLEDQGFIEEVYEATTGWVYNLTTKFNITKNTDYTKNGTINVTIMTSAVSKKDGVAINYTSTQSQTLNKDNFKDRVNLLRKVKADAAAATMKNYLDTLVPPLEVEDFNGYEETGIKYKCNITNTLYYIKTVYKISGRNGNYTKNDKLKVLITSYYGLNNTAYNYMYKTTQICEVNVNNFKTRYTDIRNAGASNRESLKTYMNNILPPVTMVPTTTPTYSTHACVTTNARYALKLEYSVSRRNNDYTYGGSADITVKVTWDTAPTSTTYPKSWSTTKKHTITPANYTTARVDVEALGVELKDDLAAYLDTLVPPLNDVPDRKYPYEAETTAVYYKLIDYSVTKQTNYTQNGKATITIIPKWGVQEDKYTHTVKSLIQTLEIGLNNYSEHENLAKTLLKNVEKQLNSHLDSLLGPIDSVPDIYTDFKLHPTNGLYYRFRVSFLGDSYKKFEEEGTHDIRLSARWQVTQDVTKLQYYSAWRSYSIPEKYQKFTVTIANYYNYSNLTQSLGLDLLKDMTNYIGTLIGRISLPKSDVVEFVSKIGMKYYLKTTYSIDTSYTVFGQYNEENTEGKYVLINIKTVCGETTKFELGEYVDQDDPADADFLYDKEMKIFNSVFQDHTTRLSSLGETQREQICKKLEERIGVTILPGDPVTMDIDENGKLAVLESQEVVPITSETTGIEYYVKTKYTKLPDNSDKYDVIRIETVWCKVTDPLDNLTQDLAYSRKYPDHLSGADLSYTYETFQITAKNYPNHTELLMGIGANQRSHTNDFNNKPNSIGLKEYLETLIGMVAVYSNKKYITFSGTTISNDVLDSCIVVPDPQEFVYYTVSGKLFYMKTTFLYAGSATTENKLVDDDEYSCDITYTTIYGPNANYSNAETFMNTGTHTITPENFTTRTEDLLKHSSEHFRVISQLFGIWDVEVPKTEVHPFANRGGVVWYIKIVYTQGETTNTSNTINYRIVYSRDKDVNDATAIEYGSYSYLINNDTFQGVDATEEAIIAEANNYRSILEEGLYIPQILDAEPDTDPHIPYTIIKSTEEADYRCNDFNYTIKVDFSKLPDSQTERTEANRIFVRDYIDGIQYGTTTSYTYVRTVEEAAESMDQVYEEHIRKLQTICDKSPTTKTETVQRYNFSFQVVGTFSKDAGNTEVIVSTKVDGLDFYFGADVVHHKYMQDFITTTAGATYDHLTENQFLNYLDDAVQVFNTYALYLREMIQTLPLSRTDSFAHSIELENYSLFNITYGKDAGNPNYRFTIKCDGIEASEYDDKEVPMFSSSGINAQVFRPSDIVVLDTGNALLAMKEKLDTQHNYYPTVIRNLDGLEFGFRYTISKDSNSNVAIVRIYVDEELYREFEADYTYNNLIKDRENIYNTIEQEIDNIKTKTYCTEIVNTSIVPAYDGYTGNSAGGVDNYSLPEGAQSSSNTADDAEGEKETRLNFVTGTLDNYNDTGFSYSYSINFEKDPNDKLVRLTFMLDNRVYKTYTHSVEVDSYDKDINEINKAAQDFFDSLVLMLAYNPKNTDTTPYTVEGFDYTCGATYLKLSGSEEVIINILVDGIVEETFTDVIQTHYGTSQTAIYTPLDDIRRIINRSEQEIMAKIASFRGLTRDLIVFNKNGFSFNLSTVYTKDINHHTIKMESFIDSHQYGQTVIEELTPTTRLLIDDSSHSSQTYHGRGLSVIEDMKLALQDVPADTYKDFNIYGFKFNIGVKYTKTKGADEVFVNKMLDSVALGDYSTMTFDIEGIDNINTLGLSLLGDMESYFRDYCPANNEYVYVPTGTDLPFVIRTIYSKEKNTNNVYITTSLDGATYGATSVKTFDINNISELRSDVEYKENLLKQQLERGPKDYSEEYVVKNCVFRLDIKYSKAQDNLSINSSLYLDDVRYGEVRTEQFDMTNPRSVTEYPNQMLAQLKSLLADTIPEDIISTYSRGKYTFDMEITFTKSSGSDVVTITYKINSADVYTTSLSTGALISG